MNTRRYIPEIDGLRAVAVISVLLYHLESSFLPGGFIGVDVFFVISGYVVARSLQGYIDDHQNAGSGQYLLDFYARRFRRILPALLFCLFVTTLAAYLFIPASYLSELTEKTGRAAFLGLSNLVLGLNADTYFAPRSEYNPFTHTWSLGVEEQFYLVLPLFFLLTSARTNVAGIFSVRAVALVVLIVTSIWIAGHWGNINPNWAFYLLPARLWELAVGTLVFQYQLSCDLRREAGGRTGVQLGGATTGSAFILGWAMIAAGLLLADPKHFPFPWAALPVFGSALVIFSVTEPKANVSFLDAWLRTPIALFFGRISYSLYLWHWPVIVLMRWTIGMDSMPSILFATALSIALAFASRRLVEIPFQKGFPQLRSATVVLSGIAAVLVLYFANGSAQEVRSTISLSVTRNASDWYPDHDVSFPSNAGQMEGRQLFAVGDSHTGAYLRMFREADQDLGLKFQMFPTGSCNIANIRSPASETPTCLALRDSVIGQIIAQAKPGDIVFFASLRSPRLSDQWVLFPMQETVSASISAAALENIHKSVDETRPIVDELARHGIIVVLDTPKPVLPSPPFRCSDWFNQRNPICSRGLSVDRSVLLKMNEPVVEALRSLEREYPSVYVWDPFPLLCPGEKCSAFDDAGLPMFFDGDHLSGHGNALLYADFKRFLLAINAE